MAKELVSLPSIDTYNIWMSSVEKEIKHSVVMVVVPSADVFSTVQYMLRKAFTTRHISLVSLSLRDSSLEEIKKILSTGFLGQRLFYWLYDIENISKQLLTHFFNYCMEYSGPHVIIVAGISNSSIVSEWHGYTIVLPTDMSKEEVRNFCAIWYKCDLLYKNIEYFFAQRHRIMLNSFSYILPYVPLLSRPLINDFEKKYLPRLFNADPLSLFSFMDLFWQKNVHMFYAQWFELKSFYGYQFWITFWSEQFFRAYAYTDCMKTGQVTTAQQIAARKLTFFYMKTAWKKVDMSLLKELHDIMYMLDYMSKNGSISEMMEYVYMKWFAQQK